MYHKDEGHFLLYYIFANFSDMHCIDRPAGNLFTRGQELIVPNGVIDVALKLQMNDTSTSLNPRFPLIPLSRPSSLRSLERDCAEENEGARARVRFFECSNVGGLSG